MQWFVTGIGKLFGLFVDDGSLAVSAIIWVALCWAGFRYLSLPPSWGGTTLFIGVAVILAENTVRGARMIALAKIARAIHRDSRIEK